MGVTTITVCRCEKFHSKSAPECRRHGRPPQCRRHGRPPQVICSLAAAGKPLTDPSSRSLGSLWPKQSTYATRENFLFVLCLSNDNLHRLHVHYHFGWNKSNSHFGYVFHKKIVYLQSTIWTRWKVMHSYINILFILSITIFEFIYIIW